MMMIESRSQICERHFNYEKDDDDGDMFLSQLCDIYCDRRIRCWWWWWSSRVHRSVNGTWIMKKEDGDGDLFLSQICDIYFDRNIRWWGWWRWSSLVHRSVNGTSIMNQYVMVMCYCHRSVIYTSIEQMMMMLESPSYQLLAPRTVPEVRHATVSESAILQITSRNVQNIIVRFGLRSEYRSASDILPQV